MTIMSISVTEPLRDHLKNQSKKELMSISGYIRRLILEDMRRQKDKESVNESA